MSAVSVASRHELVVGLEVCVRMATRTKLFCRCATETPPAANASVCPVCLALPGTLPMLSLRAVELATRAAIVLGCTVSPVSSFARRHGFSPELPRGYQLVQGEPLATRGILEIGHRPDGSRITVGVRRIEIEEEVGGLLPGRFPRSAALDLNRGGAALLRIVSEPEVRSPEAAVAFANALLGLLVYAGVCDARLEAGHLRLDAHVSVRRPGETALHARTTIASLGSVEDLREALEVEFTRQCAMVDGGRSVTPGMLDWDAAGRRVQPAGAIPSRDGERLLVDPDLPPLVLGDEWLARVRREMPEQADERRARFVRDYALDDAQANMLVAQRPLADYFEHAARHYCRQRGDYVVVAKWILGEMLSSLRETGLEVREFRVRPADLAALLGLVRAGTISRTMASEVWRRMVRTGELPAQVVEREVLSRVPLAPRSSR